MENNPILSFIQTINIFDKLSTGKNDIKIFLSKQCSRYESDSNDNVLYFNMVPSFYQYHWAES